MKFHRVLAAFHHSQSLDMHRRRWEVESGRYHLGQAWRLDIEYVVLMVDARDDDHGSVLRGFIEQAAWDILSTVSVYCYPL